MLAHGWMAQQRIGRNQIEYVFSFLLGGRLRRPFDIRLTGDGFIVFSGSAFKINLKPIFSYT